jgi:formylglycine-generating enzyme required for sulfatase activity
LRTRQCITLALAATLVGCGSSGAPSGTGGERDGSSVTAGDATADSTIGAALSSSPDAHPDAFAADTGTDAEGADVEAGTDAEPGPDADADAEAQAGTDASPCPAGMVHVQSFCVDTYEAYVVEVDDAGAEHPHSPYANVDGLAVRAKIEAGVVPQGYISQLQATTACQAAGKRLCSGAEFRAACSGPDAADWYPYGGQTDVPGYCNEDKGSMMPVLFGNDASAWTYADFNDPRLNQIDGGLAPTGSYPHCMSPYGVFDCMGNLHEWGNDDSSGFGRLRGGYYGDAKLNGPGCLYVIGAHGLAYHDYTTGFRCCADAVGGDAM